METKPRSNPGLCARPGCSHAKLMHGRLGGACSNFVERGSKEAHDLRREAATQVTHEVIDSALLDRVLMAGTIEHQNRLVSVAKRYLTDGLTYQRNGLGPTAQLMFECALETLGTLGAA